MKSLKVFVVVVALQFFLRIQFASAAEINTNEVSSSNAPSWVKVSRVDRVVSRVQRFMEWDLRKVKVVWYSDQKEFQHFHHYDSSVLAVTQKPENTIHLGPRVDNSNFDAVFGHELVHAILFQKYKKSIPNWLEEGLANYASKHGTVDYRWIASQPFVDVKTLGHPFLDSAHSTLSPRYHYQVSTALIQMIASKCNLEELLQLSLGTSLENYLSTTCELDDINASFQTWVKKKNKANS